MNTKTVIQLFIFFIIVVFLFFFIRNTFYQDRNQISPRERLSELLDDGLPFLELFNMANYLCDEKNPEISIPGASIISGIGFVNGVRCLIWVDDSGINAGSWTEKSVEKVEGIRSIQVKLVWEPKWHKEFMSEDAKLALDIF